MTEVFLALYLFAGVYKDILRAAHVNYSFFDPTLIFGALTVLAAISHGAKSVGRASLINQFAQKTALPFWALLAFQVWAGLTTLFGVDGNYPLIKTAYFVTNLLPVFAVMVARPFQLKTFAHAYIGLAIPPALFYFLTSPNIRYYLDPALFYLDYVALVSFGLGASLKIGAAVVLTFIFVKPLLLRVALVWFFVLMTFHISARGTLLNIAIVSAVWAYFNRINMSRYWATTLKPALGGLLATVMLINLAYAGALYFDGHKWLSFQRALFRMGLFVDSMSDKNNAQSIMAFMEMEKNLDAGGLDEVRENTNSSVLSRVWHYEFVAKTLIESPLVAIRGIGFGSYGQRCCDLDGLEHPHNMGLEIWVETGLIGLTIMAAFFIPVFIGGWRNGLAMAVVAACAAYCLLNAMKSSSIIQLRDLFLFSALVLWPPSLPDK